MWKIGYCRPACGLRPRPFNLFNELSCHWDEWGNILWATIIEINGKISDGQQNLPFIIRSIAWEKDNYIRLWLHCATDSLQHLGSKEQGCAVSTVKHIKLYQIFIFTSVLLPLNNEAVTIYWLIIGIFSVDVLIWMAGFSTHISSPELWWWTLIKRHLNSLSFLNINDR